MYDTQEIANKIKSQAKNRKISMKELLFNCDLNINAVSEFSKGKQLSCISLAKIADYLDSSVDYLLGREPSQSVTVKNVRDNVGVVGQANAPVTINSNHEHQFTTQEQDLLRIYNLADGKTQMQIMNFIYNIEDAIKKE